MENYGEIFKTYREARGLSIKDIAESGLSTSQLSRLVNYTSKCKGVK